MEGLEKPEPVITISHHGENASNAINSVLRCRSHLGSRLHIVSAGFDPKLQLTEQHQAELSHAKLEIVAHGAKLNLAYVGTLALLHVPPDLEFHPGALETLMENMNATHHRHAHFAVTTNVQLESRSMWNHWSWIAAWSYGFLNVLLVLDTFRSVWKLTKYHRWNDLRMETLRLAWPHEMVQTPIGRWTWFWGTGVSGTNRATKDAMQKVEWGDAGWRFVFRSMYLHAGFGIRWSLFLWLYYFTFAWPWWSSLISDPKASWLSFLLYRDLFNSPLWLMWHAWHLLVVTIITMRYTNYPLRILPATILLYPFYLAAFPLIYLVGQIV